MKLATCRRLNAASLEHDDSFFLLGLVLALALYNGVLLDAPLPRLLYRRLLQPDDDLGFGNGGTAGRSGAGTAATDNGRTSSGSSGGASRSGAVPAAAHIGRSGSGSGAGPAAAANAVSGSSSGGSRCREASSAGNTAGTGDNAAPSGTGCSGEPACSGACGFGCGGAVCSRTGSSSGTRVNGTPTGPGGNGVSSISASGSAHYTGTAGAACSLSRQLEELAEIETTLAASLAALLAYEGPAAVEVRRGDRVGCKGAGYTFCGWGRPQALPRYEAWYCFANRLAYTDSMRSISRG